MGGACCSTTLSPDDLSKQPMPRSSPTEAEKRKRAERERLIEVTQLPDTSCAGESRPMTLSSSSSSRKARYGRETDDATATVVISPLAGHFKHGSLGSLSSQCSAPTSQMSAMNDDEKLNFESLPEYTMKQVWRHRHVDDAWLVFDGLVFDVSSFLGSHPGGAELMVQYLGTDASMVFAAAMHTDEAQHMRDGFIVGKVKGGIHSDSYCHSSRLSYF